MLTYMAIKPSLFYNHLILSGTKIGTVLNYIVNEFYNHLILSGTKMPNKYYSLVSGFTIT